MGTKQRDVTFDVIRAICIVWIVCFCHATNYINAVEFLSERTFTIMGWFTTIVLGTFTFMSSYFLKRKKIDNAHDVWNFYLARFKRFWLLYFLASGMLYVASSIADQPWYPSFGNFVLSLFGLTIFFQPLPPTLWYMVMIMFFYLITPPIQIIKSIKWKIVVVVAIYMAFLLMLSNNWIEIRVLWYYPMYVLGLILPDVFVEKMKSKCIISLLGGIILTGMCTATALLYESRLFPTFICVAGFPVILAVSEMLAKVNSVKSISTFISYSSLCMYLFHRHFYLTLLILWNMGSTVGVRDACFPIWFVYLVACPSIIFGSYLIQRAYDYLLNRWWK